MRSCVLLVARLVVLERTPRFVLVIRSRTTKHARRNFLNSKSTLQYPPFACSLHSHTVSTAFKRWILSTSSAVIWESKLSAHNPFALATLREVRLFETLPCSQSDNNQSWLCTKTSFVTFYLHRNTPGDISQETIWLGFGPGLVRVVRVWKSLYERTSLRVWVHSSFWSGFMQSAFDVRFGGGSFWSIPPVKTFWNKGRSTPWVLPFVSKLPNSKKEEENSVIKRNSKSVMRRLCRRVGVLVTEPSVEVSEGSQVKLNCIDWRTNRNSSFPDNMYGEVRFGNPPQFLDFDVSECSLVSYPIWKTWYLSKKVFASSCDQRADSEWQNSGMGLVCSKEFFGFVQYLRECKPHTFQAAGVDASVSFVEWTKRHIFSRCTKQECPCVVFLFWQLKHIREPKFTRVHQFSQSVCHVCPRRKKVHQQTCTFCPWPGTSKLPLKHFGVGTIGGSCGLYTTCTRTPTKHRGDCWGASWTKETRTLLRLQVKKRSSHLGSGVDRVVVVGFSVEGVAFFRRPVVQNHIAKICSEIPSIFTCWEKLRLRLQEILVACIQWTYLVPTEV